MPGSRRPSRSPWCTWRARAIDGNSTTRILSNDDLVAAFARPRAYRLAFTNGVFDLLHAGHVETLERARALGDRLVVGVNSDASVRRLKGPTRPFVEEQDRARLVAALRCVDAVTLFDEETPSLLIERLLPDVLVKGADYAGRTVAGAESVERAGGQVCFVDLVPGQSTTDIARRIRNAT